MPNEKRNLTGVPFKAVPTPQPNTGVDSANSVVNLVSDDEMYNSSLNTELLESFRTSSDNRENLFKIYDEMGSDPIISGALDLYAEDSTEYNEQGRVIWVTSEDPKIAEICNRILLDLGLDEKAYEHIYSLCKYGDLYLETFRGKDEVEKQRGKTNLIKNTQIISEGRIPQGKDGSLIEQVIVNIYDKNDSLQNYIEMVDNPAQIFELTKRGKCVGYIKVPQNQQNDNGSLDKQYMNYQFNYMTDDIVLFDATKYIHICLPNPSNRNPEQVELFRYTALGKDSDSYTSYHNKEALTYKVRRGKSILYDVYRTYKELSLLTDSLLLNRLVRSAIVRILQVEVGEMGKTETRNLLQKIKSLFEQKTSMNKDQQMSEYNSPAPLENNVYVPTRNGTGAISVNNIGGDVNIRDIADIDYFNNKLFAGLKVPKQFLGYVDDNAGFSGGESLTKISGRYAKSIKRIQNTYRQGIKTLLNIYLIDRNLITYVNKFQVNMRAPTTLDEEDRMESLNNKASVIDTIMRLLDDVDSAKDKIKMLKVLFEDFIDMPDVNEVLDDILKKIPEESKGGEGGGNTTESGGSSTGGLGNFGDNDLGGEDFGGGGEEFETPETFTADGGESEQPEELDNDTLEDSGELPSPGSLGVDLSGGDELE